MRLPRRRTLPPAIALTPLVDVVFILLIFFMLASSFLHWRAIDLSMPDRVAAEAAGDADEALVIRLRADGGMSLAGETISETDIGPAIDRRLAADPDLRVVIRPEEGVTLQRAVDVLDILNRAGIAGVSMSAGE